MASHSEAWPITGRPGLSQGGRASHREAGPLTGRPGLSQGGRTSHRETGPLTGRPSLSQEGRASHREAGPLTGRLGLSQGGWPSHREAGPLTGRMGITTCQFTTSQPAKKTNKNLYFQKHLYINITRKSLHFYLFCNKTMESFTLLASQNPFGLGAQFPRSSTF